MTTDNRVGLEARLEGLASFEAAAKKVNDLALQLGNRMQVAANQTTRAGGQMQSALGGVLQVAAGMVAANIAGRVAEMFTGAAGAVVSFASNMEVAERAWGNLLGSLDKGRAMVADLMEFARVTPFNTAEVEASARQLVAYGFAVKDVKGIMTDLGNVVAVTAAGSTEAFKAIAYQLGQMKSLGKATMEDMRIMSQWGINLGEVFAVMSQQTGKTVSQLKEMQSQGTLAASTFIAAFRAWAQGPKFADAMQQGASTLIGSLNIIKDSLLIVANTAFQPLFSRLSELAQKGAALTSDPAFPQWGARMAAVCEVVMQALGGLGSTFGTVMMAMAQIAMTVGQIIYTAFSLINPFARHSPSLVEQVESGVNRIIASFGLLETVTTPLRAASAAIEAFEASASAAVARFEAKTRDAAHKALGAFGSDIPDAYDAADAAIKQLGGTLATVDQHITDQEVLVAGLGDQVDTAQEAVKAQERAIRDAERAMRPYEQAVRAASAAVEAQREVVDAARGRVDALKESISSTEAELRGFSEAPIEGMKAYEDQIAGVEQRINETELALMRMKRTGASADAIAKVETQLQKLKDQASELRLEERVKFDPMQRQIKNLTDTTKELSFKDIVAGIGSAQQRLVGLQAALGPATTAWENEQAALKGAEANLKSAEAARDAQRDAIEEQRLALQDLQTSMEPLQESYTKERDRLQELKQTRSDLNSEIDGYKQRMEELVRMAEQQQKAAGAAAGGLEAGGLADPTAGWDPTEALQKAEEFKAEFNRQVNEMWGPTSPWKIRMTLLQSDLQIMADRMNEFNGKLGELQKGWDETAKKLGESDFGILLSGLGKVALAAAGVAAAFGAMRVGAMLLGFGAGTGALGMLALALALLYVAWQEDWTGIVAKNNEYYNSIAEDLDNIKKKLGIEVPDGLDDLGAALAKFVTGDGKNMQDFTKEFNRQLWIQIGRLLVLPEMIRQFSRAVDDGSKVIDAVLWVFQKLADLLQAIADKAKTAWEWLQKVPLGQGQNSTNPPPVFGQPQGNTPAMPQGATGEGYDDSGITDPQGLVTSDTGGGWQRLADMLGRQQLISPPAGSGLAGGSVVNVQHTYQLTAHYSAVADPGAIMTDLQAMVLLANARV